MKGNEFLFDLSKDSRERANLARKFPDRLADLKQQWEQWNGEMLPITQELRTHGVTGKVQADKYAPEGTD